MQKLTHIAILLLLIVAMVVPTTMSQAQATASITISNPIADAMTSNVQVVVSGTGTALPENNVVVRAVDNNGTTLIELPTTVDAELGGTGNWSVVLNLTDVASGTRGQIVAFSPSPADGSNVAEARVNVTFGQPQIEQPIAPAGAITITSPVDGEMTSNVQVAVSGTGSSLPENNVVVRAEDNNGTTLAEVPTTVDAELGGTGNWSAVLNLSNVSIGTPGHIFAFAPSPADGSIITEARASVVFGETQIEPPIAPAPGAITITNPANNSVLDITGGSANISGTARDVFENNVVVHIRDQYGRTVKQAPTTADASGNWALSIEMLAPNGAEGSVRAFSSSPADGSIVAEAIANVTFASNCVPREDWPLYTVQPGDSVLNISQRIDSTVEEITLGNCLPNPGVIYAGEQLRVPRLPEAVIPPTRNTEVSITSPVQDDAVNNFAPMIVTGITTDADEGNTIVRVLDTYGHVIDEVQVTVTVATNRQGRWEWQAELDPTETDAGAHGIAYAYAISPLDDSVSAADAVNIVFGSQSTPTFVTITSPQPYTQLDNSRGITVTGTGGGLYEGTVVVQAVDDKGMMLAQVPTIINAPDAGTGGQGDWEVTLDVGETRRGRIVAVANSPADGSIMAYQAIDMLFGDPTALPAFTLITFPLPQTVVTNATPLLTVSGRVGEVDNDRVTLNILDETDSILLSSTVPVDGETGLWSLVSTANTAIQNAQSLNIQVVAANADGGIIAADEIQIETRQVDGQPSDPPAVVEPLPPTETPEAVQPLPPTATPEAVQPLPPTSASLTGTVGFAVMMQPPEGSILNVQLHEVVVSGTPSAPLGSFTMSDPFEPIPFEIVYNPTAINDNSTYSLIASITDPAGNVLLVTEGFYPVITNGVTSGIQISLSPA